MKLLPPGYLAKNSSNMNAKVIGSEVVYDGFFKLFRYRLQHSLFNGGNSNEVTREVLSRPDAVAVLLVDPVLKEVVLVRQFRVGALRVDSCNPWLDDVVAGIVENGEDDEEVARREVQEETGLELIGELEKIGHYFNSAGGSTEKTTIFYGEVNASGAEGVYGLASESEDILVVKKPIEKFLRDIERCVIDTSNALIAGLWLKSKMAKSL